MRRCTPGGKRKLEHHTLHSAPKPRAPGIAGYAKGEPVRVRTRPCVVCGQPVAENERHATMLFKPTRWLHLACLDAEKAKAAP